MHTIYLHLFNLSIILVIYPNYLDSCKAPTQLWSMQTSTLHVTGEPDKLIIS